MKTNLQCLDKQQILEPNFIDEPGHYTIRYLRVFTGLTYKFVIQSENALSMDTHTVTCNRTFEN